MVGQLGENKPVGFRIVELTTHPAESVLTSGVRRLLAWGIPLSIAALVFPSPKDDGLFAYTLIHLVLLQVITFMFTMKIAPLVDADWFPQASRPFLARSAALIAAAVGFSALLTLSSSAAARYDVSLQFLQLLSSLDIAWVVAALYLGVRRLWGRSPALILAVGLIAACVWSIAVYLQVVGFDVDGGWLVEGSQLMRIVIPADMAAAIVSLSFLFGASKMVDQPTEQVSPQS